MSNENSEKLFSPKANILCLVWAIAWFIFFTFALRSHVPAHDETWRFIWAAFTAVPLTGVFWFASIMFSVTVADQKRRKRASS